MHPRDYKCGFFKASEFVIFDPRPSASTWAKIVFIIDQLNPIRKILGQPIKIDSGSRSYEWEIFKKRSGLSQHVYKNGKGAVDLTTEGIEKLEELYKLLLSTKFTRICIYRDKLFIHADFKPSQHRLYESKEGEWERVFS